MLKSIYYPSSLEFYRRAAFSNPQPVMAISIVRVLTTVFLIALTTTTSASKLSEQVTL